MWPTGLSLVTNDLEPQYIFINLRLLCEQEARKNFQNCHILLIKIFNLNYSSPPRWPSRSCCSARARACSRRWPCPGWTGTAPSRPARVARRTVRPVRAGCPAACPWRTTTNRTSDGSASPSTSSCHRLRSKFCVIVGGGREEVLSNVQYNCRFAKGGQKRKKKQQIFYRNGNEEKQPQITPISTFIRMTEFSIKCIIQTNKIQHTRRSSSLYIKKKTSKEQLHKQTILKLDKSKNIQNS